jgi:hypothetical protein
MKYFISTIIVILLIGCNSGDKKGNDITLSDSVREKMLAEKKQRIQKADKSDSIGNINWGDIRFTPYVPNYPGMDEDGVKLIENKLQQSISKVGIGSSVGNPQFVVIPSINVISKNITSTAPTMFANTYEIIFYVANIADGSTFSSSNFQFKGVGESSLKAFINGFGSLKLNNSDFINMLKTGREKALNYYKNNCDKILLSAKVESNEKNYENAILILKSIPKDVDCYQKGSSLLETIFKKYQNLNCYKILSSMKAEMGKTAEVDGYSEAAMNYYALIPSDANCYKEAQITFQNYYKKISPQARKEFELRKAQQEQNNELAKTKMELESKVAIDGQTALLDKYKKDHEYEKLPWLRQLLHLGEWDPFDASSRINKH